VKACEVDGLNSGQTKRTKRQVLVRTVI